jgi:hypothetical protein
VPKLEALLKNMQGLNEQPLEAEKQSEAIKSLQQQWRDITKGSAGKHQALWDEFKQSADSAYEVCKLHFAKLEELRKENEQKRETLIAQLEDYYNQYDWENAVWNDVEKLLRSARDEWKRYSPSPQSSYKTLQNAFHQRLDDIHAKLNTEYDKNKAEKERLINSIAPMVEHQDLQQAIDTAIKFQAQWKTIGRCQRKDNDRLWKIFRSHCDAIFERRDAQRAEQKSATDAIIKQAESQITELISILDADSDTFKTSLNNIDAIKDSFDAIEGLPEKVEISLKKKFEVLRSKIETRQIQLESEREQSAIFSAFDIKKQLITHPEEHENILNSDAFKTLPNDIRKALKTSAHEKSELSESDLETRYREFCIQIEILKDKESPQADKSLRMDYQIRVLQEGKRSKSMSQKEIALNWVALPQIDASTFAVYENRFLKSL